MVFMGARQQPHDHSSLHGCLGIRINNGGLWGKKDKMGKGKKRELYQKLGKKPWDRTFL